MKVLELKPLKNKNLELILVESEFPIGWWLQPTSEQLEEQENYTFTSKDYLKIIEDMLIKIRPHYVAEERGISSKKQLIKNDVFAQILKDFKLQFKSVDISEQALGYLESNITKKVELLKNIKSEIQKMKKKGSAVSNDHLFQQLTVWKEYLQSELDEQENKLRLEIREAWMLMGILDIAKEIKEKSVKILFICDKSHFDGITNLAEELGVKINKYEIKKKIINIINPDSIKDIEKVSFLDLMAVKIKQKENMEKILYFFDTDTHASPFDINMAYDAGFDVVIPFNKVTVDHIPKLVQDVIFSRKPKAPTSIFIGGSDVKKGEKIAKKVIDSIVPPFEIPIIIDPRGSHTTAAAVVAKTIEIARKHKINDLTGKKVVILGVGPVAKIAAVIAARQRCKTIIVETWEKGNEVSTINIAKELSEEAGDNATKIMGEFAITDEKKLQIVRDADIIWALAAAGVEILSKDIMNKLPANKIVIDINLVPPYGIKGVKPKHDNEEIYPGIFATGALGLGRLKSKVESAILKEASKSRGKKIFDYNIAFETARKILFGSEITVVH